jgi:3-deoxy-D-manno-octulosonate 8-phosphate phosphatase (KDO 8-P phosphatase)
MWQIEEAAKAIKMVALDGDGVLFPNDAWEGLSIGGVSLKPKTRSHYDGQGISFLRGIGIKVCVITNAERIDGQAAQELVHRWNALPSAGREGGWAPVEIFSGYDGVRKQDALGLWLSRHGCRFDQCAVMGNDIGDYHMLKVAKLPACPSDAEPQIANMCRFVADRPGGRGAVRDLCNLILRARGIDPITLPLN